MKDRARVRDTVRVKDRVRVIEESDVVDDIVATDAFDSVTKVPYTLAVRDRARVSDSESEMVLGGGARVRDRASP